MVNKKKYSDLRKLKGLIRERGTTYEKLARRLGMTTTTFCRKAGGKNTTFTLDEVEELVFMLGIKKDDLADIFFPNMLKDSAKEQ